MVAALSQLSDSEVVGPYPAGTMVARSPGPSRLNPIREELVAKCPVHGRLPFNDPTKKPSVRRIAMAD